MIMEITFESFAYFTIIAIQFNDKQLTGEKKNPYTIVEGIN